VNVFRSLARSFWNAVDFRKKPAEGQDHSPGAAPKKERATSRLRDGFEHAYRSAFRSADRGDGFDAGARGAPVDLTGGVKLKYAAIEDPRPAPEPVQSDFVASLDDLGLLMESLAGNQPAPASPADQPADGLLSLDAFEPVVDAFEDAAPIARPAAVVARHSDAASPEPMDFFEYPAPVAAEPIPPALAVAVAGVTDPAPPELAAAVAAMPESVPLELPPAVAAAPVTAAPVSPELPPAAAAVPVPASPELPAVAPIPAEQPVATVEVPVSAAAAAPVTAAVAPPSSQYTVELLMPAARDVDDVQPPAVEQFSTLELLDIVAQLTPAEEPEKKEAPAGETGPGPTASPGASGDVSGA
jgi:hypothetical protein